MIMKLLLPVVLQLVGVAVIIAEFIVPTAGVLAILALCIFGFSLYWVFAHVSVAAGVTFVVFDLILIPALVIIGSKMLAGSRATLRDELSNKDGAVSQPPEWAEAAGKEGTTLTQLHPAGSAMIDGKKYDVVSRGEYIEKGAAIVVVAIEGNRMVVKRKE
jgi:membrane-bound serine protease (ClpP class)